MKVGILGSGSWTTALAQVLADNGHEPVLKGICEDEVSDINNNHRNEKFFKGVDINPAIKATLNYEDIADAEIILFGVPVVAVKTVATELYPYLQKPIIAINVAKGFEPQSKKRLSLIIKEVLQDKVKNVVSLIGPSHAEEVILRQLTCINSVSDDEESATIIQHLFANDYFRVYRNSDTVGAEIAAAAKNVMAIASGALIGLKQGDNARAALMTRGLAEITRYGMAFGGEKETFLGLYGVGDLIVTCSSVHSRNFQAGLAIGMADSSEEFLKNNHTTTEGILTTKTIHLMAQEKGILMPITDAVYKVLYEGKKPSEVIVELMKRPLKAED